MHEGGWTISVGDRGFAFHSPAGKPLELEPSHEWRDDILARLQQWADDHGLHLGPDVNEPQWDGTKPDYDWAVAGLMAG